MINRKLCGALGAAAIATTGLLLSAGSIFADPPSTLPSPPFHRHFLVLPDGTRKPVGPNLCEHPELQQAFNEFHYNIHHSENPPAFTFRLSDLKAERQGCTTATVPKSSA